MIRRLLVKGLALLVLGSPSPHAAAQEGGYPSLAKRPIEDRSFSPEVVAQQEPQKAGPALVARIEALLAKARAGDAAFASAFTKAETAMSDAASAATADERWVVAQTLLSAADQARYDSVYALADLDTMLVQGRVGDGAGLAEIDAARTLVLATVDGQNDRLDSLRSRFSAL